jgi:hypothetical protein
MLISAYFSLNELHFRYNEQLMFVSLATFTCKVMGISISIYELSPYEQFLWNQLPLEIEGYLWLVDL